ncbi:MAG: hypothetical protein IT492_19685 [Gammaproteobacteria bacterium]|nr:hypothetical protein [Gammaproteobacteria bacterium]
MLPLSPSIGMLDLMAVLVAGVCLELWLTRRLARLAHDHPRMPGLWQRLGAPLWRGAVIVTAVLFAYPALFGFRAAPSFDTLMPADALRGGAWLLAVLLARVVAPMLLPSARPGLLDALQGMGAVALLFAWFADYLGAVSASLWPGLLGALALLGLSSLLPALAAGLGQDFGARLDARRNGKGLAQLFGHAMGMVAVAPIVILYGYLLGMQLAM